MSEPNSQTSSVATTATAAPPAGDRRLFWRLPLDERSLDRGTDDRGVSPGKAGTDAAPAPAVTRPTAFRVDEAIATLEHACALAEGPVPRLILARIWVEHIYRWLGTIVTADNIHARVPDSQNDLLLPYPMIDLMSRQALHEVGYLFRRLQEPINRPLGRGHWDRALAMMRQARVALLVLNDEFVSFELAGASQLPAVATDLPNLTTLELRVLAWLRKYRPVFEATEARFSVDRRGMAGAVAWEALFNPRSSSPRSVGAGKMHLWEYRKPSLAVEVELRNILPARSAADRKKLLATPEGAILYIGAALQAFAEIASAAGYGIDCDPAMLANCYNAFNLATWEAHMKRKDEDRDKNAPRVPLQLGNDMAFWVRDHLPYIEDGVGVAERCRADDGRGGAVTTD